LLRCRHTKVTAFLSGLCSFFCDCTILRQKCTIYGYSDARIDPAGLNTGFRPFTQKSLTSVLGPAAVIMPVSRPFTQKSRFCPGISRCKSLSLNDKSHLKHG